MATVNGFGNPQKCMQCAAGKYSICKFADDRLQRELNAISHERRFSAGETIVYEGEQAGIIGNVISGVLRVVKTLADGRQQIVGLLLPSDMFGRIFASTEQFSVEAATDVTLCCYDRRSFERLMENNHILEHAVLMSVLDELDAARDWLILLGCQNAIEKVASFFIFLHFRSGHHSQGARDMLPATSIAVPVSRRDMAAYLGTTVETISRTVRLLARKEVIEIVDPQHFAVLNWDRLVRLSGREEYVREIMLPDIDNAPDRQGKQDVQRRRSAQKAPVSHRNSTSEILLADAIAISRPQARKFVNGTAKSNFSEN